MTYPYMHIYPESDKISHCFKPECQKDFNLNLFLTLSALLTRI